MAPNDTILVKGDDAAEKVKQQMLLSLPPEILGKIFLLTSLQTRTKVLSSVCESLNYFIFNHDLLWSKLNLNAIKNITDTTIPLIFNNNLPYNTRLCIRELYLNDVSITIESVRVVLKNCPNLRSLHLRTVKGTLEMSSLKQLIEELFCSEEEKSERVSQEDVKNKSDDLDDTPEPTGDEIEHAEVVINQNDAVKVTDKPLEVSRADHPCQLQTIYWYLDHDEWVWWSPEEKPNLENILRKVTNNPKASVQVPWCDFCNKQQACIQVKCTGKHFHYKCDACIADALSQQQTLDAEETQEQASNVPEDNIVENVNVEDNDNVNRNAADTNNNGNVAAVIPNTQIVNANDNAPEVRSDNDNGRAVAPQVLQDGGINRNEEIVQADEDGYVVITELRNNSTETTHVNDDDINDSTSVNQRPIEEVEAESSTQANDISMPGENAGGGMEGNTNTVENSGGTFEAEIAPYDNENGETSIPAEAITLPEHVGTNHAQELDVYFWW
ncbi:8273_t:CDS:2 [Acaulospora morrowiae]|uniref:8273_t:CDS:1 n=1 Tax=Acaulospora morrowiae TaxID=94023 RepID=A0A9N9F0G6_9GLOM|nr:8273_t:CDS:2 [Acaulospora morrowiae]